MLYRPWDLLFGLFHPHLKRKVAKRWGELLDQSIQRTVQSDQCLSVERRVAILNLSSGQLGPLPKYLYFLLSLLVAATRIEVFFLALVKPAQLVESENTHHPGSLNLLNCCPEIGDHRPMATT